jgi:RecJ-like exonuclease
MNAANAIIEVGLTRGRLTAVELFNQEVLKAMNIKSHYIPCPQCDGLGEIMTEHDCRGYGYPLGGCPLCDGLGYTAKKCPVCHGDKEVVVTEDEGLEVFEVEK